MDKTRSMFNIYSSLNRFASVLNSTGRVLYNEKAPITAWLSD